MLETLNRQAPQPCRIPLPLPFLAERKLHPELPGEVGRGEWGNAEEQRGSCKPVPKKLHAPPLGIKDHLSRPSPCSESS